MRQAGDPLRSILGFIAPIFLHKLATMSALFIDSVFAGFIDVATVAAVATVAPIVLAVRIITVGFAQAVSTMLIRAVASHASDNSIGAIGRTALQLVAIGSFILTLTFMRLRRSTPQSMQQI